MQRGHAAAEAVTMARQRAAKPQQQAIWSTAAAVLLAVAVWFLVGPSRFGGPATYLTTSGISMEPRFHTGDLAVVRRASQYDVGDIVAYRLTSRSLILHRIVGRDGDRFLMKGDNNAWVDSDEPSPGDIVGKLWLHIPDVGRLLIWLRSPAALCAFGAIAAIGVLSGEGKHKGRLNARHKARSKTMDQGLSFLRSMGLEARKEDVLTVAAAIVLGALVLAALAFAHPLTRLGAGQAQYDQGGTFSYSADAPGTLYADNQVSSGDPVFLQLVHALDLRFDYHFHSTAGHSLHGTYGLALKISQESGWQRSATLVPETPFDGDRASMDSQISLADVQSAMSLFETQTGISGGDFRLSIVPTVHVQGTLGGQPLDEVYAPELPFQANTTRLMLDKDANQPDPLHPSEIGVAPLPRVERNTFDLLGLHLPVLDVRILSLLLLLVGGGLVALVLRSAGAADAADEPSQIEARYGSLLMNMQGGFADLGDGKSVVDVISIEDLARVAEQQNRMILHSSGAGIHRYFVPDGDILYRYTTLARSRVHPPALGKAV